MPWNDSIRQLTTSDTTLASNFNEAPNKLLENDKYLADQINLLLANKADKNNTALTGTATLNAKALVTVDNALTQNSVLPSDFDPNTNLRNMVLGRNVGTTYGDKLPKSYGTFLSLPTAGTSGNYIMQLYMAANYFGFRQGADYNCSEPWKQIATTEKIDITLQNGWRTYDATYPTPHVIYTGGVYKVNGCIVNPSAVALGSAVGAISTNLPTSKVNFYGYSTVDNKMYCLQIHPSGSINVLSAVSANVAILL